MNFFEEQILTHRLKNYGFQRRWLGVGDRLGVEDGNAIKFGFTARCASETVKKFMWKKIKYRSKLYGVL